MCTKDRSLVAAKHDHKDVTSGLEMSLNSNYGNLGAL